MFQFSCQEKKKRQKKNKNKNNLIGFWERFDISLPWWSCLVGGDTGRERWPVLSSYLSCLPNDFREMQSAYSSLWPSVSFIYRLCQLNQARIKTTSLQFVCRQKVFFLNSGTCVKHSAVHAVVSYVF